MKTKCKYCQGKSGVGHLGRCMGYKAHIKRVVQSKSREICNRYMIKLWSISELARTFELPRSTIEQILKEHDIILRGTAVVTDRRKKMTRNTLKERYGVINPGQMDGNGYQMLNKIPKKTPLWMNEFNEYRKQVEYVTKKCVKKMVKESRIPTHCELTGVEFIDNRQPIVNPNDVRKRTVDHRKSVFLCFCSDILPDVAGGEENILFVLKHVNTIKGNMPEDVFINIYGTHLAELLKYEN